MKKWSAFLRLVRLPNLIFIVLTQVLFYCCIYIPLFHLPDNKRFILLVIASVFIAAAGYIINDYFDLNIDRVNKPTRNVLDSVIHRRWAIIWHWLLSGTGVLLTAYAVRLSHWYLILANIACVFLLWFYSTSLKKKLLIGNIVISLLTSWTILIIFFAFTRTSDAFSATTETTIKFFRLAFLYSGFAFVLSLIREAVKDVEDMKGDEKYGCRTFPIVMGTRSTKVYVSVWLGVLIALLLVLQFYVLQFGWWPSVIYTVLLVIAPLIYTLSQLRIATTQADYAKLSSLTKWIMLTGILSMLFFTFYF